MNDTESRIRAIAKSPRLRVLHTSDSTYLILDRLGLNMVAELGPDFSSIPGITAVLKFQIAIDLEDDEDEDEALSQMAREAKAEGGETTDHTYLDSLIASRHAGRELAASVRAVLGQPTNMGGIENRDARMALLVALNRFDKG